MSGKIIMPAHKGKVAMRQKHLMAYTLTLSQLLLAGVTHPTVRAQQYDMQPRMGRTMFELSVNEEFDDAGIPQLVVKTSIPYHRLVFLRKHNRYESRYRVLMDLLDEEDRHIRGEVWEEAVVVDSYQETKSRSAVSFSKRTFPIDPGVYTVNTIIEIIDTSLKFVQEREIRIVGSGEGSGEVTEPVFSEPAPGHRQEKPVAGELHFSVCPTDTAGRYEINPEAVYREFDTWPRITYNLVSAPAPGDTSRIVISVRVADARKRVYSYGRWRIRPGRRGFLELCLEFNIDSLPLGIYSVTAVAEATGADESVSAEDDFAVVLNRGMLGPNFSKTLELLGLVAEEKELTDLARAAPDARLEEWFRFWQRQDPTPYSEENELYSDFLTRLEKVLESFSTTRPGWETDRGKIYMKYGAPDKVVDRTEGTVLKNVQYWIYYAKNLVFVFEDVMGSGEYQLVETRAI